MFRLQSAKQLYSFGATREPQRSEIAHAFGKTSTAGTPTFGRRCGLFAAAILLAFSTLDSAHAKSNGYFEQAKEEIAQKGPLTAIIHLRNAVKDDPDNPAVRRLLGKLLLEVGNPAVAESHLLQAYDLEPDVETGVLLADALLQLGEADAALKHLLALEERFPDHEAFVSLNLVKANVLFALERLDDSQKFLQAYLEKKPLDVEALILDARLNLATGALDRAASSIANALDVDPSSAPAIWARVDVESAAGRFDEAMSNLDRLSEILPENPALVVARAALLIQTGRSDEARRRLEKLLAEEPDVPSAALLLAGLAVAEGRFDDSRTILQSIGPEAQETNRYLLLSGLVSVADQRYALAETSLSRYVEQTPSDEATRRILANVQLNADLASSAIATLKPLAEVEEPDAGTLQLLASAQLRAGRLDDANATLNRIVALSPFADKAKALLALLEDEQLGESRHDAVRALDHVHHGDSKRAHEILSATIEAQPENKALLILLGIIRFQTGDEAGAREAFEQALKIDPQDNDAQTALDQLDTRVGNVADVERRLKLRLAEQPGCEACAIKLASLKASSGRVTDAYDLLANHAKAQPDSIKIRQTLIRTGIALGKPVIEEPWLQELVAIGDRDLPDAYMVAGEFSLTFGQYELAAMIFERLIDAQPDEPQAYLGHARALYGLGDITRALTSVEAALKNEPGHRIANVMLLDLHIESDLLDDAEAFIEQAKGIDPDLNIELFAHFYLRSGQPEKAIKALEDALAIRETSSLAHRLFAVRMEANRIDDAISGLRSWLIRRPSDATAMDLLGDVYVQNGELRLGLRYYELALSLSDDNPFLLNDVGWVRHELGLPKAEEIVKRAYAIAPLPEIADTLAWIMVSQGRLNSGLPLLREAFQGRPENPSIRYHLAYTLSEMGDRKAARRILEPLVSFGRPYAEQQAALALWKELAH